MVRFSKLTLGPDGKPVETDIRDIKQSDIRRCPHVIFMAQHYRDDGSCRCNDPAAAVMADWGYAWNDTIKQWGSPPDAD